MHRPLVRRMGFFRSARLWSLRTKVQFGGSIRPLCWWGRRRRIAVRMRARRWTNARGWSRSTCHVGRVFGWMRSSMSGRCGVSFPFSGHLFLFRGKRADYLKVLYYDGTGLCLFAKRLESGKFVWPPIVDGKMVLTPAQLTLLIEAMDWRRTVAADVPRRPMAVG